MHKYLHILKTLGISIFWRIIHHLHLRKSTDSISVISLFTFPLKNAFSVFLFLENIKQEIKPNMFIYVQEKRDVLSIKV